MHSVFSASVLALLIKLANLGIAISLLRTKQSILLLSKRAKGRVAVGNSQGLYVFGINSFTILSAVYLVDCINFFFLFHIVITLKYSCYLVVDIM